MKKFFVLLATGIALFATFVIALEPFVNIHPMGLTRLLFLILLFAGGLLAFYEAANELPQMRIAFAMRQFRRAWRRAHPESCRRKGTVVLL
jgi:hypothetical protein